MRTVLHVGCGKKNLHHLGPYFSSGWREIRLDINPDVKPDVLGTLTDMSSIANESVDAVVSSHNIEHVYWHEVPIVLGEFKRVLKNDGFAFIRCPDLKSIAALVVADKLLDTTYTAPAGPIRPIDIIFGLGKSLQNGNHFMAHRCGFTKSTLHRALEETGFSTTVIGENREFHELVALSTMSPISFADGVALSKKLLP